MVLIVLPVWSQRRLDVKLISKKSKQFLLVKYKGEKGDFFDPITTDFSNPNTPKDSVRLMNSFDASLSGVLFFVTENGDSILYQVWDIAKIENGIFDQFKHSIYDYTNCIGFKRKRKRFKIPISLNPILTSSVLPMFYKIEIKEGICGKTIEWIETKVKVK